MSSMPPIVSVVMSVYNGDQYLSETVESILKQEGVGIEFIIINDGSTDSSAELLNRYQREDKRIRLFHEDHNGLTKALIKGCTKAQGKYIARQDVGDHSLQGRFAAQIEMLKENPKAVMTACGTRFLDMEGNHLFDAVQAEHELEQGLRATDEKQLRGPSHHGAVMFRKDAYEKAGGYRRPFLVAQDLDLWTRLIQHGICIAMPEIFYEARWTLGSISHLRQKQQLIATRAILSCRQLRLQRKDEQPILEHLSESLKQNNPTIAHPKGLILARYHYFLGSLLERNNPVVARKHFDLALAAWPLHFKAWFKRFRISKI